MSNLVVKGFRANISVEASLPLEDVVVEIEKALSISLKKNETGKFEEFVGYEGVALGISVNLIADPANPDAPLDLDIYGTSRIEGVSVDVTDFVLALLSKASALKCRRMA